MVLLWKNGDDSYGQSGKRDNRGDICHQNRLVFSDSYIPLNKDAIIYGPVGCDRNNSRVHFSRITLSARVINLVLTGNLTFLM